MINCPLLNVCCQSEVPLYQYTVKNSLFLCPIGIQKLVLAGRVGEAIEATQQLYPGLLDHNPNLLFMLK